MKNLSSKPNFLTSAIFVLLCTLYFSQKSSCQIQISLSSTTSTCENNGSVSADVISGNGPFSYKIQGEGNYESLNSSAAPTYSWTSLFPGKYFVTVTNETSISNDSIEIEGSYISLDGVASIIRKTDCPDSFDGGIMIETEGGRAPINYQLFEGTYNPDATSIDQNQTGIFENINAQVYTILAIDSCSNQIARTVNLTVTNPILAEEISHTFISCDSVLLQAKASELSSPLPYQVRIYSPDSLITEFKDSINAVFGYEESLNIKYQFLDQCGRTFNKTSLVTPFKFIGDVGDITCESFSIFYSTNYIPPFDITLTHPNGEISYMDTLPILENIPHGNGYLLRIVDSCGRSAQVFNNSLKYSEVREVIVTQNPCFLQNSVVIFNLDGVAIGPVTLDFIIHPEDFTTDSYIWNGSKTNYRIDDSQVAFKAGEYKAVLTDFCGIIDTVNFQIDETDLLDLEFLTSVTPQCSDLSHINFNTIFNTEFINPGTAELTKKDDLTFLETLSNVYEGSFTFLDTGTYYITYAPCGSGDSMVYKTITLDTTPFPNIRSATTINCENEDSLAIYVEGELGIPPYLYRIIDGPNAENYPSEWQDLPVLGKVPLGEGYKVQLLDQCGTITSSDVSEVLNLEPIVIEDFTLCDSDTVIFSVQDPLIGLNYLWTGPNNEMSDSTWLKMNKVDITGPIVLQTDLSGCASNQLIYDWSQECLVPVALLSFSVEKVENGHLLKWTSTAEIDNSHYDIQRSNSSIQWKTIGKIPGSNQVNGVSNYSFINENPSPGSNYYRLKQNDFNGNFEYSDILYLHKRAENPTIYPNPFNAVFEIKYFDNIEITRIDIFSIQGDLVYQYSYEGRSKVALNLGFLPPSIYYIRITHANMPPYITSLVKN